MVKRKKVTCKLATQYAEENRTTVVIPYVHGLSEAVTRAYRRHGISSAMKPFQTLRSLLEHPKDKRRRQDACECVYKMPCKNCDKTYIGETGRAFGVQTTRTSTRSYTTGCKGVHTKDQLIRSNRAKQVGSHRPRHLSQPRHRLVPRQGDRQRKQQNGPMDQRSDTHQERTRQVDEPRRRVLPTSAYL